MSYIKRWLEDIYYDYENGATMQELMSKWETNQDNIIKAIEIMRESIETKES